MLCKVVTCDNGGTIFGSQMVQATSLNKNNGPRNVGSLGGGSALQKRIILDPKGAPTLPFRWGGKNGLGDFLFSGSVAG